MMITLRKLISLTTLTVVTAFGVACSSAGATPTFLPTATSTETPAVSSDDAVQIALTASQDLYDNLRSLGAVSVMAASEPAPRTDLSEVSNLFGDHLLAPTGLSGAWLVEVKLSMIGAPADSGTSFTLFAIDASNGRLVSQVTSSTQLLNHGNRR